jgi:predicted outer membrane repeat protein
VDETRDSKAYLTYIDGGGKANHCLNITANATIDGLLIFAGSTTTSNGGGVNITSCAPTISNCAFGYNRSTGFGGALATYKGTGTRVLNCEFSLNTAGQCGGAIFNELTSTMQISDCTFSQNSAADSGGAIHNVKSNVTIARCMFQRNQAVQVMASVGGGILNEESAALVTNCVFSSNAAAYGAGVFNYQGSPTIEGCLFTNCDASVMRGGGVYNRGGSPTVKSCLFQLNFVNDVGGGLLSEGSGGKVVNCVFLKNSSALGGGAIYIAQSLDMGITPNPQFINCTIYGNATGWRGGAVYNEATPATFLNCILWGNYARDANSGIYAVGGWSIDQPAARYCDIQGDTTYPGTGNLRADPKLGDPNHFDFSLAFDSPCLDAGNNAAVMGTLKDYEEANRVMDGDGNGSAIVDIGACELQGQPDHLTQGEIMQSAVYDDPTDSSPTYTFMLRLHTDDGLTSVQFQAPGSSTAYTIPSDANTSNGNVETYHRVQGKKHVWEYWAKSASPSILTPYGDGTYRITAYYRNNTQVQLQVAYVVPGTATPIAQPTQKPQMNTPSYDATIGSPVTFGWGACTDSLGSAIRLTITNSDTNEDVAADVYAKTATESSAYTLPEGSYEAELAFGNLYDVASSEGTPFQCGKVTLVGHRFTVPYAAVYRFYAPSTVAHFYTIDANEKKYLTENWAAFWTYEGIAFNACMKKSNDALLPVYRFWSGRSHFYTLDENEKNWLVQNYSKVWVLEKIAFYAYADGSEPQGCKAVYRFWNGANGTHFYTIDEWEANFLLDQYSYLFAYEGVAFYAYPP